MNRSQVLESIRACGIVPAVRVETKTQVLRALKALGEGGIQVAEIVMSIAGAVRLLDAALSEFGDSMVIGAGTVLDTETVRTCIQRLRSKCAGNTALPSFQALCPQLILAAWSADADCVKVFPAGSLAGATSGLLRLPCHRLSCFRWEASR